MNIEWKLTELEKWTKTNLKNNLTAQNLIRSLSRASLIIKYHKITAQEALKPYCITEAGNLKMLKAMISADRDFGWAALAYEANLIACIHSVRNYADLVAQLINSLVLSEPRESGACTLNNTTKDLKESKLRRSLDELQESYWFKYIVAFSNTAKHRRLINSRPSISFEEEDHGVKVEAFSYKFRNHDEQHYPPHWGHEVLEGSFDVYKKLLSCGHELNQQLMH